MVNILYLTNEYPPFVYGGAGIHLSNLVESLLSYDPCLCVKIIYNGSKSYSNGERNNVYSIPAIPYINYYNHKECLLSIFEWIKKVVSLNIDFDIIHCHTWSTLLFGVYLKLIFKKPLVITCHSLDIERPWKQEIIGDFYTFTTWIERVAYQEADAIIAVSKSIKSSLINYINVNSNKIYVIFNGADHLPNKTNLNLSEIVPNYDHHIPYALFVGRMTKQKGIDYLLNAISMITLEMQFVLCLGKADSAELEEEYINKIGLLQSNGRKILILKNVYDKKIISCLYENAQLFINPSIYEPFGLTIVEALSHSLPIVSSKVGGPAEILTNNYDSILISINHKKDEDELNEIQYSLDLARAIISVTQNDALRRRLKNNAKYTYEHLPTWNKIAQQHFLLYSSLYSVNNSMCNLSL